MCTSGGRGAWKAEGGGGDCIGEAERWVGASGLSRSGKAHAAGQDAAGRVALGSKECELDDSELGFGVVRS